MMITHARGTRTALCIAAVLGLLPGSAFASQPDWEATAALFRQVLADLVAADTTNPPGAEKRAAEAAAAHLAKAGLDVQLLGPSETRKNLVCRLPGRAGQGADASLPERSRLKPFLMMAHIDVVGADPEQWDTAPFVLTEKDGHLYGRGVIDDKGMAAAAVTLLSVLASSGMTPERDILLLLTADEESGGRAGIRWILENHPELCDAEYALNEGGSVLSMGGRPIQVNVQNAEKGYWDVKLVAKGADGHSSAPRQPNAIVNLGKALARIGEYPWPIELTPSTKAFASGIARSPGHPLAAPLMLLLTTAGTKQMRAAWQGLPDIPALKAAFMTTVTPTMITGGSRVNALPSRAEANLNCRILPGTDLDEVVRRIQDAIGDAEVEIVADRSAMKGFSPISSSDGLLFRAIRRAAAEVYPSATVVPYLSNGATDSRHLRLKGVPTYGLVPFALSKEDLARMHGHNERLAMSSIIPGLKMLYSIVRHAAGLPD